MSTTAATVATATAARSAAGSPSAPSGVRLTARGRRVLLVAAGLLAAAMLLVGGLVGAEGAVAEDRPVVPGATVVVQPGQSLWAIALEAAPGSDPRETVARIRELNGLDARPVRAGQQLTLPAT